MTNNDRVSEPLRVGLVGAGPWATMVHGPVLANHPATELVGVWARRPEAAAKLASRNGTTAVANYDELLETCDAIAFCVPPDVQAEMAARAAAAGKTLLLEKPIALDLGAAQRLVDAIDNAGVRTVLLLSLRFAQPVKDFIAAAAEIGQPLGGRAAWISGAFKDGSPFATPWRLACGPLPDLGPHAIDLIDAALGRVVSVHASGDPLGWVSLTLEHETGATSTVDLCATAMTGGITTAEVYGDAGSAAIDASNAADAVSMMRVPAALVAAHRGEATDAPDARRGLHLQRILSEAAAQLR